MNSTTAGVASLLAILVSTGTAECQAGPSEFAGPVVVQGKALVTSQDHQRFMVRGVALASNNNAKDLLSDANFDYLNTQLLPHLQDLNVNTVRVYQVDLTAGHDKAMALLQANGIYVEVGMATSRVNINRVDPAYSSALRNRIRAVIDAFAKYPNVLAFSVGNEVVFPGNIYAYVAKIESPRQCSSTNECVARAVNLEKMDAAVEKSLIRDAKKYLKSKGLAIPVGMAMVDSPQASVDPAGLVGTDIVAQYYACGDDDDRADYIGINTYRYLPGGPMSAYDGLAQAVKALPIPVYLSESGAVGDSNKPQTRDWKIVGQDYTRKALIDTLSGQVAYEFFNETNNFGLYVEDAAMPETAWGGADALGAQFLQGSTMTVPMPSANPGPIACPVNFNPPLLPPGAAISVRVKNYATAALSVVQNSITLTKVLPAVQGSPSVTEVQIDKTQDLWILDQAHSWNAVCKVNGGILSDGWLVLNNVVWGTGPCNVSQ
jgi:hypothetical protein